MKKFAAFLLMSAVAACLSGCQTSGCDGWRQLHPTARDVEVISDQLAMDILMHNEHGADICSWRKPGRSPQ
jgi:hypothetical protein